MRRLVVLDIVGLTADHIGPNTPNLRALGEAGEVAALSEILPGVTCSAQSTMLTGRWPAEHGIVGNGWYFRDLSQVWLWRQSNRLVQAPKVWERARERQPGFTCANLFWWYNMVSSVDWAVTPRPIYCADGRKLPDIYARPAHLHDELVERLGPFPLVQFWGPGAGIRSSEWIAEAAAQVLERQRPDLTLVYLPHLDYDLQRFGPADPRIPAQLRAIDAVAGRLIDQARAQDCAVIALSEYGIRAVDRPVALNRRLREAGLLEVQAQAGRELLDPGESRAFAVADHQIAHVYVRDPADVETVRALLEATPGVDRVLDREGQRAHHLDHARSGELVAIAEPGAWFTYYYWLDDARAPDFARCVDIHNKPGYDPAELFLDPALKAPKLRIAGKLLRKKLGFRYLMDVVPMHGELVRGSHGRIDEDLPGPVWISSVPLRGEKRYAMTDVSDLMLDVLFR